MGIGGSIFLIAIGAIIAFGVKHDLSWLDLDVVGWVLMLCGAAGLALTIGFWATRRSRTTVVEHHQHTPRDSRMTRGPHAGRDPHSVREVQETREIRGNRPEQPRA